MYTNVLDMQNKFFRLFHVKSSIATYEEIMPCENTVHTDKHQTKQPKGIVIVLCLLVLFVLLIKVFL